MTTSISCALIKNAGRNSRQYLCALNLSCGYSVSLKKPWLILHRRRVSVWNINLERYELKISVLGTNQIMN